LVGEMAEWLKALVC